MKKFFKMSPRYTIALSVMTLSAVAGQAYAGTITVCPNGSCNFTDPVAAIAAAAPERHHRDPRRNLHAQQHHQHHGRRDFLAG